VRSTLPLSITARAEEYGWCSRYLIMRNSACGSRRASFLAGMRISTSHGGRINAAGMPGCGSDAPAARGGAPWGWVCLAATVPMDASPWSQRPGVGIWLTFSPYLTTLCNL
jgi:hypothetical protein